MSEKNRKNPLPIFIKRDWIIVAVVTAVAVFTSIGGMLLFKEYKPGKAVVRSAGQTVCELPLITDTDVLVESNGYHFTVTVQNGTVAITQADCPDKICVNTGQISKGGQTVVCLPAKLVVTLEKGGGHDARTY